MTSDVLYTFHSVDTSIDTQILKKVLNFLLAKLGYQQLKSDNMSKFQVFYWLPGDR